MDREYPDDILKLVGATQLKQDLRICKGLPACIKAKAASALYLCDLGLHLWRPCKP